MNDRNSPVITALLLHPSDNVFCVLCDQQAGDLPVLQNAMGNQHSIPKLLENIPLGHKVARSSIEKSAAVIKYGAVIGYATQTIPAGSHVHLHNLAGTLHAALES